MHITIIGEKAFMIMHFYQCKYLSKLKSEHEYFQYLSASYAEDPNYIASVKTMIEKNNLKELFK
jgi:flagellum-specific peptidoglycan hydrolase FlgJ